MIDITEVSSIIMVLLFLCPYNLIRMTLTVSLLTCQTLKRYSILNPSRLTLTHSKPQPHVNLSHSCSVIECTYMSVTSRMFSVTTPTRPVLRQISEPDGESGGKRLSIN